MTRRNMIGSMAGAAVIAAGRPLDSLAGITQEPYRLKGNIRHSVSQWCFGSIPLEEFAKYCKEIGIESIELLNEKDWPVVAKAGLKCAVGYATDWGIPKGFNRVQNHDKLVADYEAMIPKAAAAGVPNLICFSGNREGMGDYEGMINCAIGLRRIMPTAEKHGVTIIMELLNGIGHRDYMCDNTAWGAALAEMVNSERFKLLYDIYHMQIMEGNVIDTLKKYFKYIGHIHTGGVPGRNELDETQELYYPAIMKALVSLGYKGFVGQEFVPAQKDKLASLKKCIQICDV
ncbi:MAG TPA: TIM barrel protein [Bacteroidales bacterium]|jgi:hydroxypyruvate isomerase|nr:TIM barrel protein [Bacteroidales bacterium]MZP64737.1 TIM barrel protein [Bacteroidales bacterium]HNY53892.1 TIM barrel protein [Bacteroidales bacterium]HOG56512.1 TIM barrel protein [Bacteroidales bacterium]HPV16659.1 TIM barrel protein [Bacteroidales bacterium]